MNRLKLIISCQKLPWGNNTTKRGLLPLGGIITPQLPWEIINRQKMTITSQKLPWGIITTEEDYHLSHITLRIFTSLIPQG